MLSDALPVAGALLAGASLLSLGAAAGFVIARRRAAARGSEPSLRSQNELLRRRVERSTAERDGLWALSRDAFVITDSKSIWLAASPAWTRMLGWTESELLGRTSEWLEHPEDKARTAAQRGRLRGGEHPGPFVNRYRTRDGSYRWLAWNSVTQGDRFYHVARDVTEEREQANALRQAEDALRQSQKIESIGQITGGVAHDFNNLLTPIIGTLDLLQQDLAADRRHGRMVTAALEAAERARVLVQRLLAFARRQPLQEGPVDVSRLAHRMRELIESTLGPRVTVEIDAPDGLAPAWADANQLELALLNLAVNARDAMPAGGRFELSVREETVAPDRAPGLEAGRYIAIRIADDGVGMPQDVLDRAIEPFFSTKGVGRGTGLGLSMVHGLTAQLGGGMEIRSSPGEGVAITLWLPRAEPITAEPQPKPNREAAAPSFRRVLLVDDEPLVREATARMLGDLGYAVLEAESAGQALELFARHPNIDALVTDQLMPGMGGAELARLLRSRRPELTVLVVSGYAEVETVASDLPRLSKPFRAGELAQALALAKRPFDEAPERA